MSKIFKINRKNLIKLSIALAIFGVFGYFLFHFLFQADTVQAQGWLSGYGYRKQINVSNTTTTQTNYQLQLTVYKGTGTDSGSKVYLNNNVQDDFDDIIFTKSDGTTLLDYWREATSTATSTVWIEFDSLTGSASTTFYIYYSSSTAISASNGTNTFPAFDHFDYSDSPANHGWTEVKGQAGTFTTTCSGSICTLYATGQGTDARTYWKTSSYTTNPGVAIRARMQYDTSSRYSMGLGFGDRPPSSGYGVMKAVYTADQYTLKVKNGTNESAGSVGRAEDSSYHIFEVTWRTNEAKLFKDGVLEETLTTNIPSTALAPAFGVLSYGETAGANYNREYYDWVFVRKYVSPEPTFGTWGSEESAAVAPTLTTQAATLVEETTATGNGNITATGGANATTRGFKYGLTQTDTWSASDSGSFGTGAYTKAITGLSPGTLYYIRAFATNSGGTGYGAYVSFTTKPNEPTGLAETARTTTSITMGWTKGSGAENTMVRYKTGTYPSSISDGSQCYFDTGTSCTASSLSPNTTYYFRAWSYHSTSGYSDLTSDDTATTKYYYSPGYATSTNLLSGQLNVKSINSFDYTASSIPSGTTLKVQFSTSSINWYNSAGTLNGWDTLSQGTYNISLSTLNWSGANFYYKVEFTSTGASTAVLDSIAVNYTSLSVCSINQSDGTCGVAGAGENGLPICKRCDGISTSIAYVADNAVDTEGSNVTATCQACDGAGGTKTRAAGEYGLPACQRCDGVSLTSVNVTNNTQDTEGSNLCNSTCQKCSSGSCANQLSSEDLFNHCAQGTAASDGCQSNNCSGTAASCGVQSSGDGGCPTCGNCTDSDIACENYANAVQDSVSPNTCTALHYRCNGTGSCTAPTTSTCENISPCDWLKTGTARCAETGHDGCTVLKRYCGDAWGGCGCDQVCLGCSAGGEEYGDTPICWDWTYD